LRRIKRTKITVIRTETVFLRKQDVAGAIEIRQLQPIDLTEKNIKDYLLEIEAIKKTEIIAETLEEK